MATTNIAFPVNLRQNKNTYTSAYGKEVKYQEKIPVSSYAVATAEPDASNGEGGNG